jgi:hypothetical protein
MARRLQFAYLFNRTITYDSSIMPRSVEFPVDTTAGAVGNDRAWTTKLFLQIKEEHARRKPT